MKCNNKCCRHYNFCQIGPSGVMTSEWLWEMFEGEAADTCGGKFPLVSMGCRAEGLACADPEARTPLGVS